MGQGSCFEVQLELAPARVVVPDPPPLRHEVLYFEPHEASAELSLRS